MSKDEKRIHRPSSQSELDRFLQKVASTPTSGRTGDRGRLIFALDATASREPTWDQATHIQSEMFAETRSLGGLEIQLVFYRGFLEFGQLVRSDCDDVSPFQHGSFGGEKRERAGQRRVEGDDARRTCVHVLPSYSQVSARNRAATS